VSDGAAVFAAAVAEYLVTDLLELAGRAAKDNSRASITPRCIQLAIRNDKDLDELWDKVVLPESGIFPGGSPWSRPQKLVISNKPFVVANFDKRP
jgi:histone H2A